MACTARGRLPSMLRDRQLEEVVVVGRVQARIGRLRLERELRQRVVHLGRLELAQLLALVERAAQDDVEVGADALAHQVDGGERLPLQQIEVGAAERARLRRAAGRVAPDGSRGSASLNAAHPGRPIGTDRPGTDEKAEPPGAMLLAHLAQHLARDVRQDGVVLLERRHAPRC